LQPGRGSLAEVLPDSLLAALSGAAASPGDSMHWRSHVLTMVGRNRVGCRADLARSANADDARSADAAASTASLTRLALRKSDFAPVDDRVTRRVSVATAIANADVMPTPARAGQDSHRLLGTLVHRLVRRLGLDPSADPDRAVPGLLNASEAVDTSESGTVCRDAAQAYRMLCAMPDVRDLYRSGAAHHEVPFTMTTEGQIVRGTIDCLVAGGDGITVLEFKTGRARPEHARQVELYGKAVQAMYPDFHVKTRVIYLGAAVI